MRKQYPTKWEVIEGEHGYFSVRQQVNSGTFTTLGFYRNEDDAKRKADRLNANSASVRPMTAANPSQAGVLPRCPCGCVAVLAVMREDEFRIVANCEAGDHLCFCAVTAPTEVSARAAWAALASVNALPAMEKRVAELEAALKDVRDNWDHDDDAHRYKTRCRCCVAEAALARSALP